MGYVIKQHTRDQAKRMGLEVQLSKHAHKKIDVIRDGERIASVGDDRYADFPTYKQMERDGTVPKGTADKRRKAYHARHGSYAKDTPGHLAKSLLW